MKRKRAKTVTIPKPRWVRLVARVSAAGFLLIVVLLPVVSSHNFLLASSKPKGKPYALIAGTVWGPDDHPVFGVMVKIRRPKDKKPKWELYSDHMGEFAQRVPAGESDYILTADLKGLKTSDGRPLRLVNEVTVHIYNDEREDTGLHLSVEDTAPAQP
jgi:hypothetical protein